MGPAYLLWRCIDVFGVYLCDPSDLSNIINVIYLANFNHHLSCIAALHKRLYVQWVHTVTLVSLHQLGIFTVLPWLLYGTMVSFNTM